jgi:hypothetical protein
VADDSTVKSRSSWSTLSSASSWPWSWVSISVRAASRSASVTARPLRFEVLAGDGEVDPRLQGAGGLGHGEGVGAGAHERRQPLGGGRVVERLVVAALGLQQVGDLRLGDRLTGHDRGGRQTHRAAVGAPGEQGHGGERGHDERERATEQGARAVHRPRMPSAGAPCGIPTCRAGVRQALLVATC